MATRNPWPFSSSAPKRTPARSVPSQRELREQVKHAHERAQRAIDRLEVAVPGTYAFEEGLRLGRLAEKHLASVEARAYELYGIEPGRQSGLARLLRRPRELATDRRRRGLGALLFGAEEQQRARRTRSTAKTRVFTPVATAPVRTRTASRRTAKTSSTPAGTSEFERQAKAAAAGTLRGEGLAAFINRFQNTEKSPATARRRTNPDFFTAGGLVHPVRDSAGYAAKPSGEQYVTWTMNRLRRKGVIPGPITRQRNPARTRQRRR